MGEKLEDPEKDIIGSYLANVRGTVPIAIEEIDAILRLIAAAREPIRTFLDVSCDGGTLSAAILDEYPNVTGFLIEDSSARLEATRQRLGLLGNRMTFKTARYASTAWSELSATMAPYDVVIGGAELWPVPDERKRSIFREVYALLSPGGLFLNLEHVASATRWTQSAMDDQVIDLIFGEFIHHGEKKTRTQVAREFYRRAHSDSIPHAPLEVQCDWLREAGFDSVECFLKVAELAVFGGQKNEAGQGVFSF